MAWNHRQRLMVSIHAPAWGATAPHASYLPVLWRFNPRPRMGSDLCRPVLAPAHPVSIHAPAWGATEDVKITSLSVTGFNPRPRMGSDEDGEFFNLEYFEFQSTPPHGERP